MARLEVISNIYKHYFRGACAYGFVRKVDEIVNATIEVERSNVSKDTKRVFVPMLLADKCTALAISTVVSPWILPVYVYNDMKWLELRARELDPIDYGWRTRKTKWEHYLF